MRIKPLLLLARPLSSGRAVTLPLKDEIARLRAAGMIAGEAPKRDLTGALDVTVCPTYRCGCRCGPCSVCGHQKHTAIHGSVMGDPPSGGRPWGHRFVAAHDHNREMSS